MTTEQKQKLDELWARVKHAKKRRAEFVKRRKSRIDLTVAAQSEETDFYENEVCKSRIPGTVQSELVSSKYCIMHDTTGILDVRDDYLSLVYSRHVTRMLCSFYEAIVSMFGGTTKLNFSYIEPERFVCTIQVNDEKFVFE